jgi:hypothetical protein
MYVLHIYLFHYAQCVVYFIYSIITHCYRMERRYPMLEEEYDKDHQTRCIEAGQVTKIVIFFILTLVRKV